MKICAYICALLFLVGCGYEPLSKYANATFGDRVYVDISIDSMNPQGSISIKDTLNKVILSRLSIDIVPKQEATTVLYVKILDIKNTSIAEDSDGFVSHYKTTININFSYTRVDGKKYSITTSGNSDYSVGASSVAVENSRINSIVLASNQAIDKFISQIFYHGQN